MRNSFSLLALTAFLLHALLGCCLHHVHAGHSKELAQPSSGPSQHPHCAHSHASPATPHESPDLPEERCHEGQCVYVACVKVELPQLVLVPFDPSAMTPISVLLPPTEENRSRLSSRLLKGASLRSHLLLGVLLI